MVKLWHINSINGPILTIGWFKIISLNIMILVVPATGNWW